MKLFFNTFFRVLAILSAISVFITILLAININITKSTNNNNFDFYTGNLHSEDVIALINLKGPIISDPIRIYKFGNIGKLSAIYPSLIKEYFQELKIKKIKGIIISIDSPGGSVSATDSIYNIIENFKKNTNIPIYFHSKNLLASGAYWISLSADKIFTNYGSLVGSIGVKGPDWIYYNSPNALSTGFLGANIESDKGIKLFSNTAGESKDLFNPFRTPTNKEVKHLQKIVNSIYIDFVNLVSSKRKIETETLINDIGAMIYNSKSAHKNHLIDGEKNINQTIKLMEKDLKVSNAKVIHNNNNNLINFTSYLKIFLKNKYIIKSADIKNEFCDNFRNQLSVVAINYYSSSC